MFRTSRQRRPTGGRQEPAPLTSVEVVVMGGQDMTQADKTTGFVQVIQGRVTDAAALQHQIETWAAELSPGASGWLGSTGGATDDGRFIAVVRFESEEAARRNSERPEQDAWWAQTAK